MKSFQEEISSEVKAVLERTQYEIRDVHPIVQIIRNLEICCLHLTSTAYFNPSFINLFLIRQYYRISGGPENRR